jgi:hypothetical protein
MPDADPVLERVRQLAQHPPREPVAVQRVAERALRLRRRRRATVASGALALLLAVGIGTAVWAGTGGEEEGRTVVAGPGPPGTTAPEAPPAEPEPGDPAVWSIDPGAPPLATASSFTALVSRLGCNSGTTGEVLRPGVVVTETEVVVRFTVSPIGNGPNLCPANDYVPYEVEVGQPIGDRSLVDGACEVDPEAAGTACLDGRVRWRPPPPEAGRRGAMPDLRGRTLEALADESSVLDGLRDQIGQQETRYVADEATEGIVIAQDPAPGTPLAEVTGWNLRVSSGGPVVQYQDLPAAVAAFAGTLPGFDRSEPLVERRTEAGTVYKTDRWLFGLDCVAVDQAYRTFLDSRYDTACPGSIEAPGG